ncbi:cupin domain-containing protein [Pedobacter fastidiosus]|uniref:Cupin domain-containing protein n=1 Tax=Pedobacter fastidiosus TaxID=2765361 RepID=A0ABR7KSH8_9SPHI|nr:cupin domain-containing protein [Pedobacter fastidiosus]MBC6110968.1 cupin domain-containing protein [Pedobacter fastidiosus]
MKGFKSSIESETLENKNFRKVIYTGRHLQVVLMNLAPGTDIGEEVHLSNDQFFRFEGGHGKCFIDGNEYYIKAGDAIVVPAGAKHNIINTDAEIDLSLYTIYGPPNHKDAIIRATKKEAEEIGEGFDGMTTE